MQFDLPCLYCCCHQYGSLGSTSSELDLQKAANGGTHDVTSVDDVINGDGTWLSELFLVDITGCDFGNTGRLF